MRNPGLDEAQAEIKITGRNINNFRYANDTTLAESEEELKCLLMKVKEEHEKSGLKLTIQKTQIIASGPITSSVQFNSIQSLSPVQLFVTPWTAARQASLPFTISLSLLKLVSIESMMTSNYLILCHPLLLPSIFPSIGSFPMSQFFASGSQNIGASASFLPMRIQG